MLLGLRLVTWFQIAEVLFRHLVLEGMMPALSTPCSAMFPGYHRSLAYTV